MSRTMSLRPALLAAAVALPTTASAGLHQQYGDADLFGEGYISNPTAGAQIFGLTADAVTYATTTFDHNFPFDPEGDDFPGTDQIYVGENQTTSHDGYAFWENRLPGPQVIVLDYSAQVPAAEIIETLTLGIAADDFQFPVWGDPFTASINGVVNSTLTTILNDLDQTGPVTRFFTIGIDPAALDASNVLTLTIEQGGQGGDGWAIDFLTIGVTTIPTPGTLALALATGVAATRRRR